MTTIKMNSKTLATQSGTDEPVMASGVTIPAAGITGTLGSGIAFPANHASNTLVWKITAGDHSGTGSIWNSADVSFSAVSGKSYEITAFYNGHNYRSSGSENRRDIASRLFVHNVAVAKGAWSTDGTIIARGSYGRMLHVGSSTNTAYSFHAVNLIGYFVPGTTRTEYIRVNTEGQSGDQTVVSEMNSSNPAWVIVREYSSLTITEVT
jgi:hypothetical protein